MIAKKPAKGVHVSAHVTATNTLDVPALYVQVAERLRARIFAHELLPGSWIDEQVLAVEYGISRTPMREALKVLASEGLVTLKPRRGCYVTELSEQERSEVFPVMALLESRVAEDAARRATSADFLRLRAIHDALEAYAAANNVDKFFDTNHQFHTALQDIAGNRYLAQLINDAPALAAADVGLAMGTGTDVAIESAGMTLTRGDLSAIVRARKLAHATMRNIRQNLFFSFVFNGVGVPVAAGVLYPVAGILLSPMLAGAAMALSSFTVVLNALRLNAVKL